MTLWKQLKRLAAAQGEKPALICRDIQFTYSQFAQDAERLARQWLNAGLRPGDRVALHFRNGTDLALCYYACFAAGFVAVPINTRLTPAEIGYVLEHSGAKAYVSQVELRIETDLQNLTLQLGDTVAVPTLPMPDPDAPALLLYTSGTTARPKGVIHTQQTLAGNASYMDAWGLTAGDHTLLFTSMAHASGAIMLLISSLHLGATTTIVPVFDAVEVLDTWARCGATFYMALPTLVRALLTEQKARPRQIVTGRLAICGGDTVPVPLQQEYEELFGHPLVEGFGMTEGLPMLANHPLRNRPGSMGRPLGDIQIRVVDGEMWVRGSGIAVGYWGDTPFEDGWLKTGDLVEADGDGYVWFRGRTKEIIVRGGSNISPQEVEEALYLHPAVAEAGVVGEPDAYWGEVVLAFVALRKGQGASADELIAFVQNHLAEYKCPQRIVFLPALPKGITGKVQRRALKGLNASLTAV